MESPKILLPIYSNKSLHIGLNKYLLKFQVFFKLAQKETNREKMFSSHLLGQETGNLKIPARLNIGGLGETLDDMLS